MLARLRPAVLLLPLLLSTAACGSDDSAAAGPPVPVRAGDTTCEVATTTLPAGRTEFSVTNTGGSTSEVYVYGGSDFDDVEGEVEDVAPGATRSLDVELSAGTYEVACKPGGSGDGIRTRITVTA